jgi:D-tyrosyl-tRNA(Tyr) deacylase
LNIFNDIISKAGGVFVRAVVQRVLEADVGVDGRKASSIGKGFLVLVAVMDGDTDADAAYLCRKLCGLRVFEDGEGKMNRSIAEVGEKC